MRESFTNSARHFQSGDLNPRPILCYISLCNLKLFKLEYKMLKLLSSNQKLIMKKDNLLFSYYFKQTCGFRAFYTVSGCLKKIIEIIEITKNYKNYRNY